VGDKIVAYLDLLGFSNFTQQDKLGAIRMLEDYLGVLDRKVIEADIHPSNSYPSEETKLLAKRKLIDTLSNLLPFSDSIIVTSEVKDPTLFLTQLGNFVLESFLLRQRGRLKTSDPISVPIKDITIQNNGQVTVQEKNENWFPVLFRGSVVYGEVEIAKSPSIIDNQVKPTRFAIGKAIVDVVRLEGKKTRCPDILLSPCIVNKIQNQSFKRAYVEINEGYNRLLWPAFNYDPDKTSIKFSEMFRPAVDLWKYFSHLECSDVYFNFLKLIIKSTMSVFCGTSESCMRTYINNQIDDLGMSSKRDALWGV
jgi:hypothetical protein